tara:strand:- start:64565 stop:65848 length:1284 start_codon:yes stop_codon:yes gene_type:complete
MSSKNFFKWLYFGLHIKRWLALILIGVIFMALGIAYLLKEAYEVFMFPEWVVTITLQWLPRWVRGLTFIIFATSIILIGAWKLNHSMVSTLLPNSKKNKVIDSIYETQTLKNGPKIAVIGGGTGMSMLLRGLKAYTSNLTAIITVADDGGSSGRLRKDLNILPPGDIRACISALASAEPLVAELFEYRFESSNEELAGHSLGNLLIAGMAEITGSMESGIQAISRVLDVRGTILPSTLEDIKISAFSKNGNKILGESNIGNQHEPIETLNIEPNAPKAYEEAISAIHQADAVIIGPGSLFTSILPNLLIPDILQAIIETKGIKIFITNVATQHGETNEFSAFDHFEAIARHTDSSHLFDIVLVNDESINKPFPNNINSEPVSIDIEKFPKNIQVIPAHLVNSENRYHHDSNLLAEYINNIIINKANI